MRITIDFEDVELQDALQMHLDKGTKMQHYVRAAIRFFRDARSMEKDGKSVGYGDRSRFSTYNTVMETQKYIDGDE